MTRIIDKRRALHRHLDEQRVKVESLEYQNGQLQALANIGVTSSMVAHEINNLLTPLVSYSQLALQNPEDHELARKALEKSMTNCHRVGKIVKSILAIAAADADQYALTPLKKLIEDVFTSLARDFKKDRITVNLDIDDKLTIWAIPVNIQQVFMNLILNSRDALLQRGGILSISAQGNTDNTIITIADTGGGIPQGNLEKIFKPFFTTRKKDDTNSTSGSGLGLPFCKKVVDEHNGTIKVESQVSQGTTFIITLPNKN